MTVEDYELIKKSYANMNLINHKWNKHTIYEVDKIIEYLDLKYNDYILDVGCGTGRHSIEINSRNISVIGIDFVKNYIEIAINNCVANDDLKFWNIDYSVCSVLFLFDGIICLYDVIGTSTNTNDNLRILKRIFDSLKFGSKTLISVMNYEYTEKIAKYFINFDLEPEKLDILNSSSIMESTGNIFNPNFYMVDKNTHIIYRKEKFSDDSEQIIKDRRYTQREISDLCKSVGFNVLWSRKVKLGKWDLDDNNGKEILICCEKPNL